MSTVLPKNKQHNSQLSLAVMKYWETFARTGRPCPDSSEWPPLFMAAAPAADPMMIFDLPFTPKVEMVDWNKALPIMYEFVGKNRKGWWAWDPVGQRKVWDEEDKKKGAAPKGRL